MKMHRRAESSHYILNCCLGIIECLGQKTLILHKYIQFTKEDIVGLKYILLGVNSLKASTDKLKYPSYTEILFLKN